MKIITQQRHRDEWEAYPSTGDAIGLGFDEGAAIDALCRHMAEKLVTTPEGVERSDGWGEWMREQARPMARCFQILELVGKELQAQAIKDPGAVSGCMTLYQAVLEMRAAAIEQAVTLIKDEAGVL